jgi:exosortase/archaeosortase family protein
MNKPYLHSLALRYGLLIFIGLFNLILSEKGLFYAVFTPLTVYPSYFFLHFMYNASMISSSVLFFKGYYATIIPACIAGSAYYLLLILAMATPMDRIKRIQVIAFVFTLFLCLNIFRIVFFSSLLFTGYAYFDFAHRAIWYFGSTVLIALIWFVAVFSFSIKEIPFYSDVKRLIKELY